MDSDDLRKQLIELLTNFEEHLKSSGLRDQVRSLIPANYLLRDLGKSLIRDASQLSARQRILSYLRRFPGEVLEGDELMVVAGISEYARRIRELRVQEGWPIISGVTANEQRDEYEAAGISPDDAPPAMRPDQYLLLRDCQDREAAHRWHTANQIRKDKTLSVRDKLLTFFRTNVGDKITSEELRYVAGNKSEWARRSRELRTEEGWPIVTRNSGDPSLSVGVYVLAEDRQAPPHDRQVPELVRREVMKRDNWCCQWTECLWPNGYDTDADQRFLEVHHIEHHADGGENVADNLITLCNLHHDEVHRTGVLKIND